MNEETRLRSSDILESADERNEFIQDFLVESYESLDRLDHDLLALEGDPESAEAIAGIFRTVHTIKGACGFLAFTKLERLTHAAESLLGLIRDGLLVATHERMSVLLETGDAIREKLAVIEGTGDEGSETYSSLVDRLKALQADSADETAAHTFASPDSESGLASSGDPDHENRSAAADSTIRVDVQVLDGLMTLVGELVLARNQIVDRAAVQHDASLKTAAQRLNLLTSELQERVMKTRLQPIGSVWSRLPRLVRDLALAEGKRVRMVIEGEETELDRSIIEAIRDPLAHLVRNAVDHGVETPGERAGSGKAQEATLTLRAFHEGGQVNIEVADDGRGIETAKVRDLAVSRGLITPEQAIDMSERDLHLMIFTPGFSTADVVTNVSGRGVGTDVVRSNIERVGGSIDVQSRMGEGTTFRIKIPLTLAIIPALVVTSGNQRYAVPQVNLLELVRTGDEESGRGIERVYDAPVYRLRDRLLPLVDLGAELGEKPSLPSGRGSDAPATIVVLRADEQQFGLVVDGVNDSAEIVVKPLEHYLKGIDAFAGATILGDGRVALILDVVGLASKAMDAPGDDQRHLSSLGEDVAEPVTGGAGSLLVFTNAGSDRMAVRLDLIERLEVFAVEYLEHSGSGDVVQYRGEILPLVRIEELLGGPEAMFGPGAGPLAGIVGDGAQVLVHRAGSNRLLGVIVDDIVDVVDAPSSLQPAGRPGVAGTAVLDGRVTEVLDLDELSAGHRDAAFSLVGAPA